MLKGKAELVKEWVLEEKGKFEINRANNIPEYGIYGKTIKKKLFANDDKEYYVHLYHSCDKEADERRDVEQKINKLTDFLRKNLKHVKLISSKNAVTQMLMILMNTSVMLKDFLISNLAV